MIEIMSAISRRYPWLKHLSFVLGIPAIAVFTLSLVYSPEFDAYVIPSTITVLWSLLLYILAVTFPDLPPKPDSEQKFFARFKQRFRRAIFYLMGFVFLFLSIASIYLSFKLFGVWRADSYT